MTGLLPTFLLEQHRSVSFRGASKVLSFQSDSELRVALRSAQVTLRFWGLHLWLSCKACAQFFELSLSPHVQSFGGVSNNRFVLRMYSLLCAQESLIQC